MQIARAVVSQTMEKWQQEAEAHILRIPNDFTLGCKGCEDVARARFLRHTSLVLAKVRSGFPHDAHPFSDWSARCAACKHAQINPKSKSSKTHHVWCDNREHFSSKAEQACKSAVEKAIMKYARLHQTESGGSSAAGNTSLASGTAGGEHLRQLAPVFATPVVQSGAVSSQPIRAIIPTILLSPPLEPTSVTRRRPIRIPSFDLGDSDDSQEGGM